MVHGTGTRTNASLSWRSLYLLCEWVCYRYKNQVARNSKRIRELEESLDVARREKDAAVQQVRRRSFRVLGPGALHRVETSLREDPFRVA